VADRVPAFVMGMVLALGAASAAAAGDAQGPPAAKDEPVQPAGPREVASESPGPVYVRSFRPMHIHPVRLRERHGPVYFRSPLAEPTASDRDVDRCAPLACGAAVADWMMFTFRALGFPVEMALAPPWQVRPLGR